MNKNENRGSPAFAVQEAEVSNFNSVKGDGPPAKGAAKEAIVGSWVQIFEEPGVLGEAALNAAADVLAKVEDLLVGN